jgi:HK97 family phage portal protein
MSFRGEISKLLQVLQGKNIGPASGAKGFDIVMQPGGFTTEFIDYRNTPRLKVDTSSLQGLMGRNELVFACLAVKATTANDPRLIVQQLDGDDYTEAKGHPLRQLIMRPNENMTESDLMQAAIVSWDISNPRKFYCEKERVNGLLTALYPLNPSRMEPINSRSPSRELIGYRYRDGSYTKDYKLDEILVRSAPAWYDPPPLPAAIGSAGLDTSQTDYVRNFFVNGGIPPGLLKVNRPLQQNQRDDLREQWRVRHGAGLGLSGEIGVLDATTDYQKIGANLDELSSQIMRSVSESRICMVFGVPPLIVYAYVGLIRATYSNLQEAWLNFWKATMRPTYKEWMWFWQWNLLTEYEDVSDIKAENIRLRYDMSEVAAAQEDVDAVHARSRADFQAGGINLNEFRADIGKPPRDGGDDIWAGPTANALILPGKIANRQNGSKSRTDPAMQVIERRVERDMRQYFEDQYRAAASAVRS